MNTKRRIEKVEQQMSVVLAGEPVILNEPADPEQDAAFAAQVAEAIANGASVVVRTAGTEPRQRLPGVAHFAQTDHDAFFSKLYLTPDPDHGNMLNALIRAICESNNPLPVALHVTDDDDDED